jgi:hypothetical protein
MVCCEQLVPAPIAQGCGAFGRADDVGEEDRREHPIRLRNRSRAGEELLDLVRDGVGVPGREPVVGTG